MSTKSLVAYAEAKIREMIVSGELALGQKLTEEQLADHFSISTTPVHEALKLLSTMGLVIIKPRSGSYVACFTKREIENLNNVRIVIECEAIRESMQRNYKALCDDLKFNMLEAREASKLADAKKYINVDNRFHAAFFRHAENEFLDAIFRTIEAKVFTLYNNAIKRYAAADIEISVLQHAAIVRAIRDEDFDAACARMKEHILRINNYVGEG
ncbi:Transcriptional regulator, GntR family [Rhodovulum sp. PH10]|uniref:GntR family transcriptional regulator n=1 Tax=Rhodovulum sp. PH10 TaxID=1187851 RepID=UPI00027C24D1|nr:GntR family transcriptional regulator [Rhodovulum sp. PH10]EJW12771.1 Transcriptional regulator, GntR family [Rhodovulum sp. PH10]